MNFNPNKLLTADDRDPPCINKKIKKILKDKILQAIH